MVHFCQNIGFFSLFLVLNFFVDEGDQSFTHVIRRNEQLFEVDRSVRFFNKVEYCIYFPDDRAMGSHNCIVSVHTCVSFMKVACTDTGNISVAGTDVH